MRPLYAKFVDGIMRYAPYPLILDGVETWTNDPALYAAEGYLPVVFTDKPMRAGYVYTSQFIEQDGKLVQTWIEHEVPPTDEISDAEAFAIITGEVEV